MIGPGLMPARRCAYCKTELVVWTGNDPTPPPNAATRDHLFPQWMLQGLGEAAPERWRCRNKVWCCRRCNQRKGALHPNEWLWSLDYGTRASVMVRISQLRRIAPEVFGLIPLAEDQPGPLSMRGSVSLPDGWRVADWSVH